MSIKKILLVSSDQELQNALEETLSFYYSVRTLGASDDLLDKVVDFKPDLLITDFILGDINGGALCHQVKCNPATANIYVIILSELRVIERAFSKFGCDVILQKPIAGYTLLDTVMSLLGESEISL